MVFSCRSALLSQALPVKEARAVSAMCALCVNRTTQWIWGTSRDRLPRCNSGWASADVAQLASASAFQAEGCGFESRHQLPAVL